MHHFYIWTQDLVDTGDLLQCWVSLNFGDHWRQEFQHCLFHTLQLFHNSYIVGLSNIYSLISVVLLWESGIFKWDIPNFLLLSLSWWKHGDRGRQDNHLVSLLFLGITVKQYDIFIYYWINKSTAMDFLSGVPVLRCCVNFCYGCIIGVRFVSDCSMWHFNGILDLIKIMVVFDRYVIIWWNVDNS